MILADDPGDFPRAVIVLREVNELDFTGAPGFLMPRMVETMDAHLKRGIAFRYYT